MAANPLQGLMDQVQKQLEAVLVARVARDGVLCTAVRVGVAPETLRRAVRGCRLMRNVAQRLEAAL